MRRIHYLVIAILVCAGFLAYDANAGNFTSPSSTEYYHVVLAPGMSFSYTGTDTRTILIDDVTFSGEVCPPCPATLVCSFMDEDDIVQGVDPFQPQGPYLAPGGAVPPNIRNHTPEDFIEELNNIVHSTDVGLVTRCWSIVMELRDEDTTSGDFIVADQYAISGAGMIVQRRDVRVDTYLFEDFFDVDDPDWDFEISSGGGVGVGVGLGLGAAAFQHSTSQSRHYQSPYIVQNDRVLFFTSGGSGAIGNRTAIVRGRVVTSTQAPAVTTNITVQ